MEALQGCPQDIEWGIEDGEVTLLQARLLAKTRVVEFCSSILVTLGLVGTIIGLIQSARYPQARAELRQIIDHERQQAFVAIAHLFLLPCLADAGELEAWDAHRAVGERMLEEASMIDPDISVTSPDASRRERARPRNHRYSLVSPMRRRYVTSYGASSSM